MEAVAVVVIPHGDEDELLALLFEGPGGQLGDLSSPVSAAPSTLPLPEAQAPSSKAVAAERVEGRDLDTAPKKSRENAQILSKGCHPVAKK